MKYAVVLHPAMREHVERLLADESASGDAALARQLLIALDIQYQAKLVPVEFGRLDQFRIVHTPPNVPRVLSGAMPFTTAHVGAGRWAC